MYPRVIAPLITPYKETLEVDLDSFYNLAEKLSSKRIGLLVAGTTGEMPLLTIGEKMALAKAAVEAAGGRVPVIVGVGGPDPSRVLEEARSIARVSGVDALLVPPPYYYPVGQGDVEAFYSWLASRIEKPVMIYNIPSHTGVNVEPETVERLSSHVNIVGVKATVDSSLYQFRLITRLRDRPEFKVYSGLDHLLAYNLILGGSGGIVAGANVCPRLLLEISKAALEDPDKLPVLHERLSRMWSILSRARSVQGALKAVLALHGTIRTVVSRPPIPPDAEKTIAEIQEEWVRQGFHETC